LSAVAPLLYTGGVRTPAEEPAAAPAATREAARLAPGLAPEPVEREVVRETLVVIRIEDGGDFSLMHTPGDEAELALGFLLAEGWIESRADVAELEVCPGRDSVRVRLERPPAVPAATRSLVLHPSCGLCGREDAVPFLTALRPIAEPTRFAYAALAGVTERLRARQPLFAATGGSHATGLFDASGAILFVGEDIGRHAAFDKMTGKAMTAGVATAGLGAALSGRASLEMVAKAARARLAALVAVGAPSAAAIDLAARLRMTLAGFARGAEMTIYAGAERVRT
jgi:FdhD protein